MAQTIGQVIFISGSVKAVDSSGNERMLDINSMVYLGETIITEGTDSRIMLKMDNNQSITMGRNDKLTLDEDIYDPNQMPAEESIVSVEDIQEALLNDPDFDPSELEAAAAGGANTLGDSTAEPVLITHNLQDVNFNFLGTDGINIGVNSDDPFINTNEPETQFLFGTLTLSGVDVVFEGDTAIYTLTVDNPPLRDLVVEINISHIDTDNGDLIPGNIFVTIPAGSTTAQFSVDTIDNLLAESDEDFKVEITGTTGGGYTELTIGDDTQITTILDETSPIDPDPEDPVNLILIALDALGNEVAVNDVLEGNAASYVVVMEDDSGTRIPTAMGTVEVRFNGTGATDNIDYNAASQIVTIGVPFSVNTIDDYIADNAETFTAQLTDGSYSDAATYERVDYNLGLVTTTILDDSQPGTPNDSGDGIEPDMESVTLKLIALDSSGNEVASNEALEGETASYMVVLEDPSGARITTATGTVQVSFTGDVGDVNTSTQTVTLGAAFSTDILDDYIADNGETFTAQIIDDTYSNASTYENVIHDISAVTTTILDDSQPDTPNDPSDGIEPDMESVTLKLIALDSSGNEVVSNEGVEGEAASYMVVLEDPSGTRITTATGTAEVSFTGDSGDVNTSTQTVILGVAFSTDVLDDYIADNGETFTAQIIDDTYSNASAYENVIHDVSSITTTIVDNSQPGTPNDPSDDTVEPDIDTVIIRLIAVENGNPILGNDGNYVLVNEVPEGDVAQFMALAFVPGTTAFNPSTQTAEQLGSIDLTFTDQTASGSDAKILDVTPNHAHLNVGETAYDFSNQFTISLDVNATGNGGIIFNKENAYEIAQEADGSIRYALRADNGSGWVWNDTGYDLPFNELHNLTFVYDGDSNTIKLYIDGAEVASSSSNVPDELITNTNDLLFGERGNNNQPFEGQLDNIRIFNTALNAVEVVNVELVSSGLVSHYDFNGIDPLADLSGNGNNATLVNGASFSSVPVDYDSTAQTDISLGSVISTDVFDDFMADNGETFHAQITDNSYQPPASGGGYETVDIITDPVVTSITDNSLPGTPNDSTDDTIEADKDIVIIKLFAAENGIPLVDASGNYILLNDVAEGGVSQYVAFAFEPGTTVFNASTQTTQQVGTVDIRLSDDTATGTNSANVNSLDVTANHAHLNAGESAYDFTNAFSISLNVLATGNGGIIFNKENAYEIAQEADGSIRYALRADDGSGWVWNDTGYDLPFNELHNLIFSYDGVTNTIKLYIDGAEVASSSTNVPDELITNNNDLQFGERGNNNQSFEGRFDGVQIFDSVLNASEVYDLANGTSVSSGLVSYYDFDGSNPLDDKSGNGNDAVLANGAVLHSEVHAAIDGSEDYDSTIQENVPLGQVFNVDTFDDYLADNGEKFNVEIIDLSYEVGTLSGYETVEIRTDAVVTTILDDTTGDFVPDENVDTIFAVISGDLNVVEGNTASYRVELFDNNGNPVVVTTATNVIVRFNNVTTQDGDTEYSNGQTLSLIIAANDSFVTFSTLTLNDQPVDSGEDYSLTITSVQDTGQFERIIPGDSSGNQTQVITTITDVNDAPIAQADSADAIEGGTASFDGTGTDIDNSINAAGNVLDNDTDIDTPHVQLTVSAITSNDSINTSSLSGSTFTITGKYGVLNINTDGTFEYLIDNSNTDVDALNIGNNLQESFDYTVNDNEPSGALTDTDTLTITINGTNDAPDARADIGPALTESDNNVGADTVNQVGGNVLSNDADVDNINSDFSVTHIAQGLGLNVSGGNNQALVLAESGNPALLGGATLVNLNIGFSSTQTTGNGGILSYASSSNNNDFLLFISGSSLRFYLDGGNIATGISRAELFDGDIHQFGMQWDSSTGQAQFYLDGVLEGSGLIGQGHTLGTDGTLMFAQEQDSVGGRLDANQVISANFHNIDIATNASASSVAHWNLHDISGGTSIDQSGNYSLSIENNASHSSGTTIANTNDIELIVNPVPVTISGAYGELNINADGTYTYDLYDNHFAVDALNVGDELEEQFTYTMTDNESGVEKYDTAVLTLTIQGSNDAPIVSNDTALAYEEGVGHALLDQHEVAIQALGNVLDNDQDVDNTILSVTEINSLSITSGSSQTIVGTYGSLQIFSDGHYIYTVDDTNAAVDALNTGDSLTESFNYAASDGSLSDDGQLAITIQGRDDRPDAQGNSNSINELRDDTSTINEMTGNLITDNDLTEGLDSDIDNVIGDLFIAESVSDSGVAINASGGNNQALVYNELTGNNLMSGAQLLDISITLSSTDSSTGAILSYASSSNNNDFLLFISGSNLSLYVNGASVNTGITRSELFDGTMHTLQTTWDSSTGQANFYLDGNLEGSTIIQTGHTLGSGVITLAQEQDSVGGNFDANQTLDMTLYDMQITTDISSADWSMDSVVGGIVTDANGLHDFTVDNNITHSQNVADSLNNSNDIFVESNFASISDPTTIVLNYGTLTLYADGRYSYELDDANAVVQALNNGDELTETYTYTLSDGQKVDMADLDIRIVGTNDSPRLDLDSDDSSAVPGSDYQTIYTENMAPVSIADTDSLINDVDDLHIQTARIVVKNYDAGEDVINITAIAAIPGISVLSSGVVGSDFAIELTGNATIALYQQAIEAITYANTSELPDETRLIQVEVSVVDEHGLSSNTAITTISLNAAPDPVDDIATVVEGQITITDNVIPNDDQGTPSATVHEFTYIDELGILQTANAGDIVDTIFGHDFTINANGDWSYTSDQSEFHLTGNNIEQNSLLDVINYTLIDSNGDISNPANLYVTVTDTEPQIGDPVDSAVDEKYLATGSEPDPSATTVIGTLDLAPGADTFDTTFSASQSAPLGLTSAGFAVSYSIDPTGHILTASTINGPVFIVTLVNPQAANASYEFELLTALDNIDSLSDIPLNFSIDILDSDGDSDTDDFTVTVIDDVPPVSKLMTLDEDSSETITTSADATALNTNITTQGNYGIAVINPDGTLTYTPSGNYSGADTVSYTTIQDDGSSKITSVNITVNPIADIPTMADDQTIDVYEDNSFDGTNYSFTSEGTYQVSLNLIVPVQNDAIDQSAGAGDSPERMGLISMHIENALDGQLVDGSGNPIGGLIGSNNVTIQFYINDVSDYHYAGIDLTSAIAISQVDFEALKIIPKEDDALDDIVLTLSTESHEVQDDGTLWSPDIASAIEDQVITIKVHAVTDPVSLDEETSAVNYDGTDDGILNVKINEDETLDLKALLVNTFGDDDNSERHYFDVEGLEPGTQIVIQGTTRTADASGNITEVGFDNDESVFTLTPPLNWDGDMNNITITLRSSEKSSLEAADQQDAIISQNDSVTLNLTVLPVAGDVNISTPESGLEDTAIYLFVDASGNPTINTTDSSGSSFDTITGVKILTSTLSGTITTDNSTPLPVASGPYTIFVPALLADYKITPPGQSSTDMQLTLVVETTDGFSVVETTDTNYMIEVTPIAEIVATDTDNDNVNDLTINGDHVYSDTGSEDTWFNLDRAEFDLDGPWNNQDSNLPPAGGSEQTFASFSAEPGSQFRYFDGSHFVVLTNTSSQPFVDVPLEYIDSVQFKAPSQQDGDFNIRVKAKTIDTDEDNPAITDTKISGEATLTLHIDPVADQTTVSLAKQSGLEDTGLDASGAVLNDGQDGIEIDIKVLSDDKDGSETYNLKIASIADGALLSYNGLLLTPVAGVIEIINFDNTMPLYYVPKHNDNTDEVLSLSAQSVESDGSISAYSSPIDMEIELKGVADSPVNTELNLQTVNTVDYNEVVSEDNAISLNAVYQTPDLIQSYDNDGSETLSMLLTGIPDGFNVQGAQFMGGTGLDRQWIFEQSDINTIQITSPENYSGELDFSVNYVTTENDGDTHSEVQNIKVLINPSIDATLINNMEMNEDNITLLDFSLDQQGDANEVLTTVWIDSSTIPVGAQIEDQFGVTLVADVDGFIKLTNAIEINNTYMHLPEDSDMPVSGSPDVIGEFDLNVRYEVTDNTLDASGIPAVTMSGDTPFIVVVHAIADKPDVTMDTAGLTSFNDAGIDYIALASTPGQDNEYTFTFEVASKDLDSSESATNFRISGVPDGMFIKDGIYAGDIHGGTTGDGDDTGIWYIDFNQPVGSGSTAAGISTQTITFIVGPDTFVDNTDRFSLSIEASNAERRGGDSATSDPYLINLGYDAAAAPNPPGSTTTDNGPDDFVTTPTAKDPINAVEDVPVRLSDMIDAVQNDITELLSINIHGLPPGSSVSGARTEVDASGNTFWIASSLNAEITFPENYNDNNKGSSLDNIVLNITSSEESGDSFSYTVPIPGTSIHITPVTDQPEAGNSLVFEDESGAVVTEAQEDGHVLINIDYNSIDNSPAYPNSGAYADAQPDVAIQLIDGQGVLQKSDGSTYPFDAGTQTWTVPAADLADLEFIPDADFSGDVHLQYTVSSLEDNAVNTESVTNDITFEVIPVIDGYDIPDTTLLTASGSEDSFISMDFTGNLVDSSEDAIAALLKGVPVGVLVYMGDDVSSLSLAKNAGGDATSNTWNIDVNADGTLPKIWFKPEQNTSGLFNSITLTTIVADGAVTESFDYSVELNVIPVADGLSISPTHTFGAEGDDIPVNLNAMVGDLDGSETLSLTLEGLGDGAVFKLNSDFMALNNIAYDQVNDVYTLTDIPVSEISTLAFLQESFNGAVHVEAWSVETVNGDNSTLVSGDFNVDISPDPSPNETLTGTSANDTLVGLSGNDILNGLDGDDILYAGTGDDDMSGGSGLDKFVSSADSDTVTDYNMGEGDVLVLSDLLHSDEPYLLSHLSVEDDGSDNVKVKVLDELGAETGHSIILNGISFSGLGVDLANPLGDLLTKVDIDDSVV